MSLEHLVNCRSRVRDEFRGVLTHEVVHCFQYNARGTAPGGLIEGVAGAFLRSYLRRCGCPELCLCSNAAARCRFCTTSRGACTAALETWWEQVGRGVPDHGILSRVA